VFPPIREPILLIVKAKTPAGKNPDLCLEPSAGLLFLPISRKGSRHASYRRDNCAKGEPTQALPNADLPGIIVTMEQKTFRQADKKRRELKGNRLLSNKYRFL